MSRREMLERSAERILEELNKLDEIAKKYGDEDQFKSGDVITFDYRFNKGGRKYKYAALFVSGQWYVTGPQIGGKPLTWDNLVEWWERGVLTNLKVITQRKRIV